MHHMEANRAPVTPQYEYDPVANRVDQGVSNYDEARSREGISGEPSLPSPRTAQTPTRRRPRGIAYREPSDSDLDPYWNAPVTPSTPEQRRIAQVGANAARAVLRLHNEAQMQQSGESESDRRLRIAQELARDERRRRQSRPGL